MAKTPDPGLTDVMAAIQDLSDQVAELVDYVRAAAAGSATPPTGDDDGLFVDAIFNAVSPYISDEAPPNAVIREAIAEAVAGSATPTGDDDG